MQFRKLTKTLGLCSVIVASTGFAGMASAAVYQEYIYSGNGCRPMDGNRWSDFTSSYNTIRNNGSVDVSVMCPVVRHHIKTSVGPRSFAVQVNNLRAERLSCTLYTLNGVGGAIDAATVTTYSAGSQYLHVNRSLRAGRYSGEYTVFCNLPAGASIYNYKVQEYSDIEN